MDPVQKTRKAANTAMWLGGANLLIIGLSVSMGAGALLLAVPVLWVAQIVVGIGGYRLGKRILREHEQLSPTMPLQQSAEVRKWANASLAVALLGLVGGLAILALGAMFVMAMGALAGAWGRPLRVDDQMVNARLDGGGHRWARGPRPNVDGLSPQTREALGRMWLHDAQKEHGSVPAFAQLTWQLAAAGAPADLLERCNISAIQEIDHTRRCFALCETYLDRPFDVGSFPELASTPAGHKTRSRLIEAIALETLEDGCLIEDLNADFAEVAHAAATDPAAKDLAARIAREEREHAELAWDILAWCLTTESTVRASVLRRLARLPDHVVVPYTAETMAVVRGADPAAMQAHARVPLSQWPEIFANRRAATIERASVLVRSAAQPPTLQRAG